jgi:CO/xanthine dehydrogenase Mo-binding subunit
METRGLIAEWDGKRLTMSGAAKLPFFNRRVLAAMMELPQTAVDYVEYDVGGGFGAGANFIRRISSAHSRRAGSHARSNGSRIAASIS